MSLNDQELTTGSEKLIHFKDKLKLYYFGLNAATGGFLFGFNATIIGGILLLLDDSFALSDYDKSFVVANVSLGSLGGCIVGGYISDRIGRWKTMHIQNALFILGAIVEAAATNVDMLFAGRFICGLGAGVSIVSDIPYLNEISPSHFRGRLSCFYEILVVIGTVIGGICTLLIVMLGSPAGVSDGWRVLFALPIIVAVLNSLALFTIPESPKWLISKGRISEARAALMQLHNQNAELCEYELNKQTLLSNERVESTDSSSRTSLSRGQSKDRQSKLLLTVYGLPLLLVVVLMVLCQCTGSVVIRNFAPTILAKAGFSIQLSLALNLVISGVNASFVVCCAYFIDDWGRKNTLLLGIAITFVGNFILGVGFLIGSTQNVGLYLSACMLTTIGFSLGFGTVGWILSSEFFPTSVRGRAMAVSTVTRNLTEFLTNFLFLSTANSITTGGTFLLFMSFCVVSFVFVYIFLTESKRKDPREILGDLRQNYAKVRGALPCGREAEGQGAGLGCYREVNERLLFSKKTSSSDRNIIINTETEADDFEKRPF